MRRRRGRERQLLAVGLTCAVQFARLQWAGYGLMETMMFIIERRNSIPRWYYIVFWIAMLATGYFWLLLTMHVHWRPKARKSM